jgi:hypothetical protein|tara:strand:+ start:123 stop:638 length:516 start_codon:yes stop_codon:yes gene_type:complete
MAQEFVIKSQTLEDAVNQLLPSQGGAQAGVDLSASSMIVPIVNLTEAAEGSILRQDLQSALSYDTVTTFSVSNGTSTVVNTTGYWRVFGANTIGNSGGVSEKVEFILNDGVGDKIILGQQMEQVGTALAVTLGFDFIIKLDAGDSFKITCTADGISRGSVKQIASINGVLT